MLIQICIFFSPISRSDLKSFYVLQLSLIRYFTFELSVGFTIPTVQLRFLKQLFVPPLNCKSCRQHAEKGYKIELIGMYNSDTFKEALWNVDFQSQFILITWLKLCARLEDRVSHSVEALLTLLVGDEKSLLHKYVLS